MRFLVTCLALFSLFILTYILFGDHFEQMLTGDEAKEFFAQYETWAPLIAILLFITDILLPIPATAILATLGFMYGPLLGGLIGTIGSLLAGTIAYLLCCALGDNAVKFLLGKRHYQRAHEFFTHAGGWTVALSRWMIILPEMISCLAGLTRMPAKNYFIALAIGTIPMCFAYAYIGAAGLASDKPFLALAISAAIPVFLWPVAQILLNRRIARKSNNQQNENTP